jgi:protein-tyrosine-phosphatase
VNILIVCSGNTCRSPLASVILRDKLSRAPGLEAIDVSSAGVSAWDGAPASEGSFLVAMERGLDLSAHRARLLTAEIVRRADLVLTMGVVHARRVAALGAPEKVYTLADFAGNPGGLKEVQDPVGGDVATYRETGEVLNDLLDRAVARIRAEHHR